MSHQESLSERLFLGLVNAAASISAIAGLALCAPAIPLLLLAAGAHSVAMGRAGLTAGLCLAMGGALASWAVRSFGVSRPVPAAPRESEAPAVVGAWAYAIGVTVAAIPAWLLLQLPSLIDLCRRLTEAGTRMGAPEALRRSDPYSGIVLVPLFGVFALPALQLATIAIVVVAAFPLAVWGLRRRSTFPRAFVAVAALVGGLAVASFSGAGLARYADRALAPHLAAEAANARDREFALQAQDAVREYVGTTTDASRAIAVSAVAYALTAAAFLASRRLRTAFASPGGPERE